MALKYFTAKFSVGTRDTDNFGFCRPSSLQSFLQEAATLHTLSFGASREQLNDAIGVIWILMRIRIELSEPIHYPSSLSITTWTAPISGAGFIREFKIETEGREIGHASSFWVIADSHSHHIVRPSEALKIVDFSPVDSAKYTPAGKLHPIEPLTNCPTIHVKYSDLDINNHVNNARYGDFACDSIGFERMRGKFVSLLQINFNLECLPGQEIFISSGNRDWTYYVLGESSEGKKHFEANVVLSSI